jgi:hypothetical protein
VNFEWKKEWTAPAISGAVSFATGLGVGYFISQRMVDKKIEEGLQRMHLAQMQDMKKVPKGLVTTMKVIEPDSFFDQTPEKVIIEQAERAMTDYRGGPFKGFETVKDLPTGDNRVEESPEEPDVSVNVDRVNVWDEDWDVDEEMASRTADAPYILHLNEYVNNEKGYHQQQLRWYTHDSTLVDEANVVVHRPERVLGHLNFGHGSRDPDTVYIRNDQRRGEYEVVRIEGSFMQMIMGAHAEQQAAEEDLKHSNSIRRFRPERD